MRQNKSGVNWKNKEERKVYQRDYYRRTQLVSKGKRRFYGLDKRAWTGYCELCGKDKPYLGYHHWDDNNPNKGLWVCHKCHIICEEVDKNKLYIAHLYQEFKTILDLGTKEEKRQAEEKLKLNCGFSS